MEGEKAIEMRMGMVEIFQYDREAIRSYSLQQRLEVHIQGLLLDLFFQ